MRRHSVCDEEAESSVKVSSDRINAMISIRAPGLQSAQQFINDLDKD